jgi:Na+-driven multidrug efflux pump
MQLIILLPGVYLVGLQSVLVQHFNAIGLPKTVPVFWIVTLFINIVLVFVLVPRFGARGAATASTISYSLISVLVTSYFLSNTRRTLSEVFVVRRSELKTMLSLGNTK